jgi:hypothetical protein
MLEAGGGSVCMVPLGKGANDEAIELEEKL